MFGAGIAPKDQGIEVRVVPNKVVHVAPLAAGWLHVVLLDGRQGNFDVKPFMTSGIFAALRAEGYFKQVALFFAGVSCGARCWA